MGGMMVLGIVLALVGLYIQVLVRDSNVTDRRRDNRCGSRWSSGSARRRAGKGGLPMLALGIAVAIVGVFMSALDRIVRWVIEYGGMILPSGSSWRLSA